MLKQNKNQMLRRQSTSSTKTADKNAAEIYTYRPNGRVKWSPIPRM